MAGISLPPASVLLTKTSASPRQTRTPGRSTLFLVKHLRASLLEEGIVTRTSFVIALVAPLSLAACARATSTVPVRGSEPAVSQLAGTWSGEYSSEESGRSGSIAFELRAGADTAQGEVVMTSRGDMQPAPSASALESLSPSTRSEVLTINFVLVSGTEVSGVLSPYKDPGCGCPITTTFRGVISGDVIEGTFETTGTGFSHVTQRGRWSVARSTQR